METKIVIKLVIFSLNDHRLNIYLPDKNLPTVNLADNDGLDLMAKKFLQKVFKIESQTHYLEQLYTFSDSRHDAAMIDIVYLVLLPQELVKKSEKKNWYELSHKLPLEEKEKKIVDYALQRLRWKVEYTNVVYSLLPREFTFSSLQSAYEAILGRKLDKRNFRKKIMSLNLLKSTGRKISLGQARPAELFSFRRRELTYVKVI